MLILTYAGLFGGVWYICTTNIASFNIHYLNTFNGYKIYKIRYNDWVYDYEETVRTYFVWFLRREDASAHRLPDFLHLVPEFLLLQGLVRLALTRVVFHRLLQTARIACVYTGTTFNFVSVFFFLRFVRFLSFFFFFESVSRAARVTICQFGIAHLFCFSLSSRATFRRVLQPSLNRESGRSLSCKICVRLRRTHSSNTLKITPLRKIF